MNVDQDAVYESMRARLYELFGPGGSFRISLGRATADDAIFVSTAADTIAWSVASQLAPAEPAAGRRLDLADPEEAEYRRIWKHVEAELIRRHEAEASDDVEADVAQANSAA